jgi:hypothetical protein
VVNILTPTEAANALRCDPTDPQMVDLLPQVDAFLKNATGWDWSLDTAIDPTAKAAARMLLVMWHEDPAMMAQRNAPLGFGLDSCITQLKCLSANHLEFQGRSGSGSCKLVGAAVGDTVTGLVGLIGSNGSQVALFETVISVENEIQQLVSTDLSARWYRVNLTPVGAL